MSDLSAEAQVLLAELSQSAGFLFGRVFRNYRQRLELSLSELELSLYEYVVLRLVGMGAGTSQGEIGRLHGIDRTTMVSLVDKLEKRELLQRSRNAKDRRSYHLSLTPRGAKELARAKRVVKREQDSYLSPLSEEEWQTVRGCLRRLIEQDV